MDVTEEQTISIARAEAEKMQAAIAGAETDAKVSMSRDQFAVLSRMIVLLCDLVSGPPGKLGDPKYWVPLEMFVRVRELTARLQADCDQLRAQSQPEITLLHGNIEYR